MSWLSAPEIDPTPEVGVAVHARGNQGQLGPGRRLRADRSVPVAHPTFGKDFSANCVVLATEVLSLRISSHFP